VQVAQVAQVTEPSLEQAGTERLVRLLVVQTVAVVVVAHLKPN
jgi:hypothetical protein